MTPPSGTLAGGCVLTTRGRIPVEVVVIVASLDDKESPHVALWWVPQLIRSPIVVAVVCLGADPVVFTLVLRSPILPEARTIGLTARRPGVEVIGVRRTGE